ARTAVDYLSSSGVALLLTAAQTARRAGLPMTWTLRAGSAPDRIVTLSGLSGTPGLTIRSA
ncbi:hypothetical protein K7G98_15935, partial [Saccharothrix sp. MB29]|nr:hypothetical protein [Saccharothrix sp. MB29]